MKYIQLIFSTLLILNACISDEVEMDSTQAKIHFDLALELAQYSLYQNSLKEFELAIKYDPTNSKFYRKKGSFPKGYT